MHFIKTYDFVVLTYLSKKKIFSDFPIGNTWDRMYLSICCKCLISLHHKNLVKIGATVCTHKKRNKHTDTHTPFFTDRKYGLFLCNK
jgi:hypothetical protein